MLGSLYYLRYYYFLFHSSHLVSFSSPSTTSSFIFSQHSTSKILSLKSIGYEIIVLPRSVLLVSVFLLLGSGVLQFVRSANGFLGTVRQVILLRQYSEQAVASWFSFWIRVCILHLLHFFRKEKLRLLQTMHIQSVGLSWLQVWPFFFCCGFVGVRQKLI